MNLFKKTLKISAKIILGIFIFYLLLTLFLIPLICPGIIKSQATKLIKHEVGVRSVSFNPFLWKLKIKDFSVFDSNHKLMIGFDKFWIDVSFIGLLKKKYHVESLGLSGIKVNIVLLDDGNINLLGLIPPKKEITREKASADNSQLQKDHNVSHQNNLMSESDNEKTEKLPLVIVDLISIDNSLISFTDQTVNPFFLTSLSAMDLKVANLSTLPDCQAKITFKAKLDEKGIIVDEALVSPFAIPISLENVFKLNDYVLQVLTPYVGKYTGRSASGGKLNLSMEYRIADNKLDAKHKILIKGFDFGDKVESKDALNLPFGLALGLLEDAQNRINISLPVDGDISSPDFHYLKLVGQVARNFFFKIVTKPFSFLVSLVGSEGSSEEYGYINFLPGKHELTEAEKEKLNMLVQALNERPRILLAVNIGYDPVADWRAIKTEIFESNFNVHRKETTRSDDWIYEQMYKRRFGMIALWNITKKYKSENGKYDFAKINQEIKRQLIGDGAWDKVALEALGEKRAKIVCDFIIAAGMAPDRISIGVVKTNQASAGFVPVELEIKVFDDSAEISTDASLPADK